MGSPSGLLMGMHSLLLGLGLLGVCRQKHVAVHGRCNHTQEPCCARLERQILEQASSEKCLQAEGNTIPSWKVWGQFRADQSRTLLKQRG